MQGRALAVVLSVVVVLVSPIWIFAADAQKPIGRITASFGKTALEGSGKPRGGDLYSAVNNEDRVVTDGGGVSILLASRVVLKMDAESAIRISETPGQTMIVLEHGTVHVYVGQRPTPDAIVTLADANSRIECKQGVFLASYSDKAKEGYYACEHGSVALTCRSDNKQATLAADKQIVVKNHQSSDVVELDRVTFDSCKQYLERLDQISVSQGSDTFRMRSRTLDTQTAISQLAAAGWIDKAALAKNNQAAAAANTDENSTATSSDSNTSSDGTKKKSTKSNNSGNTNTLSVNSNDAATAKADPTPATPAVQPDASAPPAQSVDTPDLASNSNNPPPVDLGKTSSGPKSKVDHGKDGMPAAFTTPPVVNAPAPVDIADVPKGGTPIVTAPPVLDVAPPVNVSEVPVVTAPVVVAPPVDLEGPGKSNGKGHGKGGSDAVTLSVEAPPVIVAPPVVNIADVPKVDATPIVTPPLADIAPAPTVNPPPVDLSSLPPVNVPVVADVGGKGGKGSGKDLAPLAEVVPAPIVTPPVTVAPPPVIVAPPVVTPPPVTIDVPKFEPPTLPPINLPPVNVAEVGDVGKGKGAIADLPIIPAVTPITPPTPDVKIDVPVLPPAPVLPPVADAGGPPLPANQPVAPVAPTDSAKPDAPLPPVGVIPAPSIQPATPPAPVADLAPAKPRKGGKGGKGH